LLNRLSNDLLTLGRYQQIATDSAAICRIKRIDCKTEGCGTGSAQDHNVGRCYGVNYNFIGSFDNGNPPSVFANSGREIVMTPMQAGTLLHFKWQLRSTVWTRSAGQNTATLCTRWFTPLVTVPDRQEIRLRRQFSGRTVFGGKNRTIIELDARRNLRQPMARA